MSIEDADFWTEMQSNRYSNLLERARLKSGIIQKKLAEKLGVRQNMITSFH